MVFEEDVSKKIKSKLMQLSEFLLDWFDENKRELPFRKNRSLYSIWISEVMLQQTKVDTVIPYFNSWMKKFPNIKIIDVIKVVYISFFINLGFSGAPGSAPSTKFF